MCGRFALTTPQSAVLEHFGAAPDPALAERLGNLGPRWNVCPTTQIPVVARIEGARRLTPMRWGFLPHWYDAPGDGPLLINARSETVAEKPAFRDAARRRRCLIPADGFYEWLREGGAKRPFWVAPEAGGLVALAGVWEVWRGPQGEEVASCAVVTCEAGPPISAIHHRAPVAVAPEDHGLWLGEEGHGAARLMRPAPEGFWRLTRVSPAVNSSRADGPELIEPWDG